MRPPLQRVQWIVLGARARAAQTPSCQGDCRTRRDSTREELCDPSPPTNAKMKTSISKATSCDQRWPLLLPPAPGCVGIVAPFAEMVLQRRTKQGARGRLPPDASAGHE